MARINPINPAIPPLHEDLETPFSLEDLSERQQEEANEPEPVEEDEDRYLTRLGIDISFLDEYEVPVEEQPDDSEELSESELIESLPDWVEPKSIYFHQLTYDILEFMQRYDSDEEIPEEFKDVEFSDLLKHSISDYIRFDLFDGEVFECEIRKQPGRKRMNFDLVPFSAEGKEYAAFSFLGESKQGPGRYFIILEDTQDEEGKSDFTPILYVRRGGIDMRIGEILGATTKEPDERDTKYVR